MATKRKTDRKGKKQRKPTKSTNKYSKYTLDSGFAKRSKTCPKCSSAVFMAEHKDRWHCGKCGYMEKK